MNIVKYPHNRILHRHTKEQKKKSGTKNNMNELQNHFDAHTRREYTHCTFIQNSTKYKLQRQESDQHLSRKRGELPRISGKPGKDENAHLLNCGDGFTGACMLKLMKLYTWKAHSLFFVGYYLFYTNGLSTLITSQRF